MIIFIRRAFFMFFRKRAVFQYRNPLFDEKRPFFDRKGPYLSKKSPSMVFWIVFGFCGPGGPPKSKTNQTNPSEGTFRISRALFLIEKGLLFDQKGDLFYCRRALFWGKKIIKTNNVSTHPLLFNE